MKCTTFSQQILVAQRSLTFEDVSAVLMDPRPWLLIQHKHLLNSLNWRKKNFGQRQKKCKPMFPSLVPEAIPSPVTCGKHSPSPASKLAAPEQLRLSPMLFSLCAFEISEMLYRYLHLYSGTWAFWLGGCKAQKRGYRHRAEVAGLCQHPLLGMRATRETLASSSASQLGTLHAS